MKTPHSHIATTSSVSSKKIFKLERKGRYEDALAEIRHIWPDLTAMPDIADFESHDAAEALLRCGSLIGFLGHVRPIPNAQERSKNLLTEARTRFLEIYDVEKIAECENYLALAYWRTGEINEVELWIEESQSHDLRKQSFHRLYSHSIKCLVMMANKDYDGIISYLTPLEADFMTASDDGLKGDFFNNIAVANQELGSFAEAVGCFERARASYQKSDHKTYLGIIENNLAMLYKRLGRFIEARQMIDNATKAFRQVKDRTREGFSLDTRAQILIDAGEYGEALKTLQKAIPILRKTENSSYLIDTLMTKVKTLVFLDDISEAALCLFEAVEIAKVYTGEKSVKALTKEFEAAIRERVRPAVTPAPDNREVRRDRKNDSVSGEGLRLVLPQSISHYTDYQGVWINGSHLEKAGLTRGALAVVVNEEVKRGDLVAIAETDSDLVSCGYYDADFGMISLEADDAALQIFDENAVKILGRIVGVCNTGTGPDGKMIVEPVKV